MWIETAKIPRTRPLAVTHGPTRSLSELLYYFNAYAPTLRCPATLAAMLPYLESCWPHGRDLIALARLADTTVDTIQNRAVSGYPREPKSRECRTATPCIKRAPQIEAVPSAMS